MSKELEALERLHEFAWSNEEYKNDIDNTDYQIIEKSLKALEVIREKKVDTAKLTFVVNAYFYNNFGKVAVIPITQEEFDLVTEVLYGKDRVGN